MLLPKIERLLSQSQNFAILRAAQELVELSSGRGGDGSGEGTKVFGTVSASSYLNGTVVVVDLFLAHLNAMYFFRNRLSRSVCL